MRSGWSVLGLLFGFLGMFPDPAEGQIRRPTWGLTLSFTPSWKVPDYQNDAFSADDITLSGTELTIGFVRGETRGADWGVSYIWRSVEEGGIVLSGDVTTVAGSNVRLHGVELHRFQPFGTIEDRVQIGLLFGVGVGVWRGDVFQSTADGPMIPIDSDQLLTIRGKDVPVVPIGRFELAGAVIVTPRIKVRVSGGIGFPGSHVFSVGVVGLLGGR